MKTVEITKAKESLESYTQAAEAGPIVLTRNGEPVAALVSIQKMDLEQISLATNEDFLALIERARARHRAEGGLSVEEARRALGLEGHLG
jgi:prevent-host-death family protein